MRPALSSQSSVSACAALGGACLTLLLLCSACAVDERTLLRSESASGASGASGAEGFPSNPALGDAGARADLPRCFYLGDSVEMGCETLVKNAGFSSNAADWSAEPVGITESWLKGDANDDPHSGSLVVMNTNFKKDESAKGGTNGGAARQCVPVTSGRIYDLAADIFVPGGQGMGFEGTYTSVATLSIFFYDAAECEGRTASNFTSAPVISPDEWVHVEGTTIAPKEALSMAVRLATLKPFRQNIFEAHFDNVFVQERAAP